MTTSRFFYIVISSLILMIAGVDATEPTEISLKRLQKDITYLASDELEGRGNFTKGIELAASYIEKRFKEIGLKNASSHIKGAKGFKQTFSVFKIQPVKFEVTFNGKTLDADNIAAASTLESLDWNNASKIKIHVFEAKDDVGKRLAKINQRGGLHFILVDKSHKTIFNRYKSFFRKGFIKERVSSPSAIVLVLVSKAQLKNFTVKGKPEVKIPFKVKAQFDVIEKSLTNLVGILPGQLKPDEIILFSAHYDHLGKQATVSQSHPSVVSNGEPVDHIYNGADDDASGTTAVINLAQYFAARKDNARTLAFVTFSGEELGGYGSRFFAKQLNPDDIVAMINVEMIGKHSQFGVGKIWMTGAGRSNLQALLNQRLRSTRRRIYTDPYPEQGLFYRSDNATLARLGVPAHSFSSTQIDKDSYYHQVSDEVRTLDIQSMREVINTIADSSIGLIIGEDTPTRIDKAEVTTPGQIF